MDSLRGVLRLMNHGNPCEWDETPCNGSWRGLLPSINHCALIKVGVDDLATSTAVIHLRQNSLK